MRFSDFARLPLTSIKGVGPKSIEKLGRLGIHTVGEMLLTFPLRYEDRSRITPIRQIFPDAPFALLCTVVSAGLNGSQKKVFNVVVKDDTGVMTLSFFRFNQVHTTQFKPGKHFYVYGTPKHDAYGLKMSHPTFKAVPTLSVEHAIDPCYHPIYPLTEGVGQDAMRGYVEKTLVAMNGKVTESETLDEGMSFVHALNFLHKPPSNQSLEALNNTSHPFQTAMIKDELLAYSAGLLSVRGKGRQLTAAALPSAGTLREQFLSGLPFSPTGAQSRVVNEIDDDLSKDTPMMRLVQGDVGSGKTWVAAMAALRVIEAGGQVALMAPTAILAEQHAIGFAEWFAPLGIRIGYLSGDLTAKQKSVLLRALVAGEIDLLIGTHAIFQDNVEYLNLMLIIIDEQHRFGVGQRLSLLEKGKSGLAVHQLVMTATPIPRTLAMVAYADLNTSVIDELPPGRSPVKTVAVPEIRRHEVIDRIRHVCETDRRQVYWVCTLIDSSEQIASQAATETFEMLSLALPAQRVGLIHGRMKLAEKQSVMEAFKAGDVDVLVATTVIEVGVNVPNASLMIIENPERLGLAQLHQLRGRVGRGEIESTCVLLYRLPLTPIGSQRLNVLRESNDGFVVAQKDLELRGPGEMLGIKQTGMASMRLADLSRDELLLPPLNAKAAALVEQGDPLVSRLVGRWMLDYESYGSV